MPELSALRARLKDRQVKAGALGTTEITICTDQALLDELRELEAQRADVKPTDSELMYASVAEDDGGIDQQIIDKRAEVKAQSITVVFQALSSVRYQEVANQFDDPDDADAAEWARALVAACYLECWADGEKVDLTWPEIQGAFGWGEWTDIRARVLRLNQRKQDIPFSSKPSKSPARSDEK